MLFAAGERFENLQQCLAAGALVEEAVADNDLQRIFERLAKTVLAGADCPEFRRLLRF